VEDGLNGVQFQNVFEQSFLLDAPFDHVDPSRQAAQVRPRGALLVADQADHVGASFEEPSDNPGAEQTAAAGDQHAPVLPKSIRVGHGSSLNGCRKRFP
jgi:hypothetical protein